MSTAYEKLPRLCGKGVDAEAGAMARHQAGNAEKICIAVAEMRRAIDTRDLLKELRR